MNRIKIIKNIGHRNGHYCKNQIIKLLSTSNTSQPKFPIVKQCQGELNRNLEEIGQPTYWTHPHLFQAYSKPTDFSKQITPGLTRQEFEERRDNYVHRLQNYQNIYFSSNVTNEDRFRFVHFPFLTKNTQPVNGDLNFIAIIPSALVTHMSPDVPNQFKQNSDFLYLTGFKEPNSVLVISKTDASSSYKTALFVRDKNPKVEIWEGPCTGSENVKKLCGIELAFSPNEFKPYLNSLLLECITQKRVSLWRYPSENVFKQESGPYCQNDVIESALESFIQESKSTSTKLIDMNECEPVDNSSAASYFNSSRYFVQLIRSKKSPAEIELMRKACDISSDAFIQTMKVSHPYVSEHLLYAKFDFECRIRGSEYLAYIPVIAGGSRATSLHYIRNNQLIKPESLLLMDAGCQLNDYASDITRTWPVNGRFRGAQKDLYEMCLRVQKHCISKCAPGISIQELYYVMMRKIGDEVSQFGLIDRKEFESVAKPNESSFKDPLPTFYLNKLTQFCPHDVGHYLGLDVHDCPEVSKMVKLEPNMVVTIEPGIYIQPNDESVPRKFRGIGIRIEDDIVVTENGCDVLSKKCPKEIEDIEILKNNS